jgi:hypothetical protein
VSGGRERDDREGDGKSREECESKTVHESSFREGFGFGGGRQVF